MMSEEGGDDSPPRPKRKIKRVVLVSSSSDSDSDESVGVAGTRRKRLRVISDGENSDSSGSSIICSAVARRRTLPKLRDSEAESDSSGWMSDGAKVAARSAPSKPASGFASDSSEGNSDKCSICLLRFKDQQVGTPETCEHIFCLDCITEWSKNVNTCPVDRIIFNKIIVKACAGGRVLRTEEVKVVERSPSIEILVTEDLTVCEVCGNSDNEETMLLCDGCDLGYHMQCLTPALTEVPADQWLCSSCTTSLDPDSLMNVIELSEVEDLLNDIDYGDSPLGPRPSLWRQPRNVRRSSRTVNRDQPSTSSGSRSNNVNINELPTTSRSTGSTRRTTTTTARRKITTKRRKYKRRRTKTVIIEYEVQENGKFPITKRVKRKVRRRKVKKRQPRTAARRSHVRASVRARLASLRGDVASVATGVSGVMGRSGVVRRSRAALPALRLFGNPNELDYFSDEDTPVSEEASTAVAVAARSTSNILSAYRQARRKMVSIPSPPHASSAPDILSNILESQTLLHSKQSIISISVDGNVDYKLTTPITNVQRKNEAPAPLEKKDDKVDLSKAQETVRSVPSYGGQGRGGGGWGGGYRGNYHRDQGAFRAAHHAPRGPQRAGAGASAPRDHGDHGDHYARRPPYPADAYFERRRPAPPRDRYGGAHSWQSPAPRNDIPPAQSRHSFGGFENPVDMRMGQMPPHAAGPRHDALPPQAYRPMSEPPVFNFQKTDIDKSEDEKSDSGLIIDTEKYDPMEPTNDDSGEDETAPSASAPVSTDAPSSPPSIEAPAPPSLPPAPPSLPPSPPPALHPLLAGIDAGAMNVPPNILDTAVRQVLKEHRNLLSSPVVESRNERSDDDSDGDCPNFSIYSATSVHIANNTTTLTDDIPRQLPQDNLEDLVQEDDETPPSTSPVVHDIVNVERSDTCKPQAKQQHTSTYEINEKKKTEEEYKEKISKRCPITTNTRNPIKIKLNTPSLIKRQVSLYDEEDKSPDEEDYEKTETSPEVHDEKSNCNVTSPKYDSEKTSDRCDVEVKTAATDMPREVEQNKHLNPNNHVNEKNTETHNKVFIEAFTSVIVNKEKENVEKGSENNEENLKEFLNSNSVKDPVEEDLSDHNEDLHDHADIDTPETDMALHILSPKNDPDSARTEDNVEKMTESISETEDERSYTPCLDENRSVKDASFDVDKDKGLEGLGTEMISEEEGNEMFSENERPQSEASRMSPPRAPPSEDGEIADKRKEGKKSSAREDSKKKKKKDSKKEGKEKSKTKKKGEVSFKKLSKSGKERNYRERDKEEKKSERERRDSGDDSRNRRRKEKRKDLERYDVRTVVTEKRRKQKDPFGRDVSPRGRSPSLSPPQRSPSGRRSHSPPRRRSPSPVRRRSPSPARRRSPSPTRRRSLSRHRSPSPSRRRSLSRRRSPSVRRRSLSRRRSPSLRRSPSRRRSLSRPRRSGTPRASPRRRSPARRKRRRSASRNSRAPRRRSASASPPRRLAKKKKRSRRALRSPAAAPAPAPRPPSPRTPPPTPPPDPALDATLVRLIDEEVQRRERRRREPERRLARRARDAAAPSKEVFTSGDNILVSVSFKEQERGEDAERRRRRETRREKRRRRRAAPPETEAAKPVAIIDLERSPFRELTPSPKHVIVLSDSDHGERAAAPPAPSAAPPEPAPPAAGPKTPPSPAAAEPAAPPARAPDAPAPAPAAALSPDAYDPFEPTRSPSPLASPPSASPPPAAASPPRALLTLEAAQRSNLSADDVLDRRPLTPVEKVLALLASCEEAEGAEAAAEAEGPAAPVAVAPRIVLPSPTRAPPKLFPGKPSPIKSNPVKPMQALRLPRAPAPGSEGASPYSPGSSDFGELFEPPPRRARAGPAPARDRKRGSKTQVGVKLDDDNLKILDDLPSSAVEMQVKSKFLKKLNRQERVVEEVKLVLKPHYNKKHVTKEEYKDILRRAVPKICHNKSGEINPTKIQALVEAYVKKFRKKHKLGVA